MIIISNKKNIYIKIASFLIAIFPILSPYSIFGDIPLMWFIGFLFVIFTLPTVFYKKNKYIMLYCVIFIPLIFIVCSLNSFFILNNYSSLINSILGLIVNTIIIVYLWHFSNFNYVLKFGYKISLITIIFAIIQLFCVLTIGEAPNGRIPFLDLNSGQTWVSTTWGYRFNSLFSESSYFAIYLLPIFSVLLFNKQYKKSLIIALGIVLSSSTLGIIIMAFIILYYLSFNKDFSLRKKIQTLSMLTFLVITVFIISSLNPKIYSIINRTLQKILNIFDENNSIRFFGYLDYYFKLPSKEMIFGVGIGQFQNYFNQIGISVLNYSNSIIMTLLQFGLIGLISIVFMMVLLFLNSYKNKSLFLYFIFLLLFMVDFILLSDRYYYLLYFVIFYSYKLKGDVAYESFICNNDTIRG